MRILSPVSRGSFSLRLSAFDTVWALLTPLLALWIRGAPVLSASDWPEALIYCALSFTAAIVAFLMFRVRDGMTPMFAVQDAIGVVKAVLVSEFVTCLVLFTATRLDGVPRTTPLIHALLLIAGMIIARAWRRMMSAEIAPLALPASSTEGDAEHIVVIGSNQLSSLYIEFLRAYAPERHRVIAILDDNPDMAGRSIGGVRILGPTLDLIPVIEEFKEHGIGTDRIIVGGDREFLTAETRADIHRLCAEDDMTLDFVPELLGLGAASAARSPKPAIAAPAVYPVSGYFRIKRAVDLVLVSILIVMLLPLFIAVSLVVLLDVGSPILFWQRRVGMNGRPFQIHKFRTMKPAFDWRGMPIGYTERMSWVGKLLRKLRLDELPQLLNVLVGDMSLIGPRPLLPQDQPADPDLRLSVRPGITGLAQVCGGTLLSAAEKNEFDEWYIHHAGLRLDLGILARTFRVVLTGERRDPHPLPAGETNAHHDRRIGTRTVQGT
jgi:lipopolysaccharide/colanic/teichoic acid biosynthesis glycosyltransferase